MDIAPSEKQKLKILESGKEELEYRVKVPHNDLLPQNIEGMKKYKAVCKSCGEILCTFYSPERGLERAIRVEGISRVNMKTWRGCRGVNLSPDGKVNFECCCGAKDIYEPSLNQKRYTEYKILIDRSG